MTDTSKFKEQVQKSGLLIFVLIMAGVLALSTYLIDGESLATEATPANQETHIFQAHGLFDPMVPMSRGEAARDRLLDLGYNVAWKRYPMAHQVCAEEIEDVGGWLNQVLSAGES